MFILEWKLREGRARPQISERPAPSRTLCIQRWFDDPEVSLKFSDKIRAPGQERGQ